MSFPAAVAAPGATQVFLDQVVALARANLKARYRKTFAGFLWVILNPVLIFCVQAMVFRAVLKIEMPRYGLFLLTGLLPWLFISQTAEMCTSIFTTSGRLLKSYPVSPLVYLGAQLVDCAINFTAAFAVVLVPVWLLQPADARGFLLLPLAFPPLVLGVLGMAWLLAIAQVYFRDTRFLVTFAMGILFYLTPIFYPLGIIPESVAWLAGANPLYLLIAPFRSAIYEYQPAAFAVDIACAWGVAALWLATASLAWKRGRNGIYFQI
jgi:lipopolysaccharide transport system permease protein